MEREPLPLKLKLSVAAAIDYPAASEILVSFPDKWELVRQLKRGDTPLYIAALPPNKESPRRDHFYGLPTEINLELTSYRLYKFFHPWPMPSVTVAWDEIAGTGQVIGGGDLKIQLQPIGQAQVWYSEQHAVLWECYLNEAGREAGWQDLLSQIWQAVEKDIGAKKLFTQPHEPTFEEDYTEFLSSLDYHPDPEYARWWSKSQ